MPTGHAALSDALFAPRFTLVEVDIGVLASIGLKASSRARSSFRSAIALMGSSPHFSFIRTP